MEDKVLGNLVGGAGRSMSQLPNNGGAQIKDSTILFLKKHSVLQTEKKSNNLCDYDSLTTTI
jgi:hypothetical protein